MTIVINAWAYLSGVITGVILTVIPTLMLLYKIGKRKQ